MELTKAIENRRSVRNFTSKKPDWRDIIDAIDSMRYAPMSGGNFSLKFLLVSNKEKIQTMATYAAQPFIANAQYVVVICSEGRRTKIAFGEDAEKFLRQQAGAAIENFLLTLTQNGLSTCWIGHFNQEEIKHLLKVPKDVVIEGIFPIGFELKKPKTKKSLTDFDSCMFFEEYGKKNMKQ